MPMLNINGKKISVDDNFLKLSPEQQSATVDEIAKSFGPTQTGPSPLIKGGQDIAYAGQYDNQKPSPNLLDSTLATVNGLTGSVPFLQQASDAALAGGQSIGQMATGKPVDFGANYNAIQQQRQATAAKAPLANAAGEVVGTLAAPAAIGASKLGAEALGMTGNLGRQLLNSSASTAAYEGAQGLSHGHTGGQLLADEGLGFLGGGAGAVAGKAVEKGGQAFADAVTKAAQNKLTKAAIVNAPSADELKNVSRDLFHASDAAGVKVDTDKFTQFVGGLVDAAKKDHINETLDPKAFATYHQLFGITKEALDGTRPLTLSDLHTIRQIAQKAAVSSEGRDSMFANRIVDGLDQFISKGTGLVGGDGNNLLKAISTWGRAKRVSAIEEAVYKAQNQASGLENGLRTQFRAILQNPKKRALYSDVELKAIKDVANGTGISNLTRLLGMFGFDFGSGRNMVGGSIGALVGGLPAVVAGSIARKGSEALTTRAANKVAKIVATPNIPIARQAPNLLAPAAAPVNILVRGGAMAAIAAIPQTTGR